MFNEVEIRDELGRLGLVEVSANGEFHTETTESWGTEYSTPIIQVAGLTSFGDIQGYNSSRKLVFSYGGAVLKTGESGLIGFFISKADHEDPEEKKGRKERAFTEFDHSRSDSKNGLPTVKPVCLIHVLEEDEYLLVEPNGLHLKWYMGSLLRNYADRQRELALTVEALGVFFRTLREHDVSYKPNIRFREFVFEHMLRFGWGEGYRILLTDNPSFTDGYSSYGVHRDILRQIKRVTSGNEELTALVNREYRKGYLPRPLE